MIQPALKPGKRCPLSMVHRESRNPARYVACLYQFTNHKPRHGLVSRIIRRIHLFCCPTNRFPCVDFQSNLLMHGTSPAKPPKLRLDLRFPLRPPCHGGLARNLRTPRRGKRPSPAQPLMVTLAPRCSRLLARKPVSHFKGRHIPAGQRSRGQTHDTR